MACKRCSSCQNGEQNAETFVYGIPSEARQPCLMESTATTLVVQFIDVLTLLKVYASILAKRFIFRSAFPAYFIHLNLPSTTTCMASLIQHSEQSEVIAFLPKSMSRHIIAAVASSCQHSELSSASQKRHASWYLKTNHTPASTLNSVCKICNLLYI